MNDEKPLSEQESLHLITNMISKVKCSSHDRGIDSILWGTVVFIASMVSYLEFEFDFNIGFDIWLIVLLAIIPQAIITIKERKSIRVRKFEDDVLDIVWFTYGITLFGVMAYQNIVPAASVGLIHNEGWEMIRHSIDGSQPDKVIMPFTLSIFSIYLLIFALPTLITGRAKKFMPMTIGAIITYGLFVVSCYTQVKYDMLLGAFAALCCWLVPGILIRKRYLEQKKADV